MAIIKQLKSIYQLKITLKSTKPSIYRTVLVDSTITLEELHMIIQSSMGWWNSHLHQFEQDSQMFALPYSDGSPFEYDEIDERKVKLFTLLSKIKDKFDYEYDFGDGWLHTVELQKILPFDKNQILPVCIKAKMACPPENVGGVWGYKNFLEIILDPQNEEYEEMIDWIGGKFDPDFVDLKEINAQLQEPMMT